MNTKLKKSLIIVSITSLILFAGVVITFLYFLNDGFWITSKNVKLRLGDKEQIAMITIDEEAIHPNSIELKMVGNIDGQGILRFGWNDTSFYHSDTISGKINTSYKGDWYSDTTYFKYEPLTATKGDLTINYKIFSSKK